MGECATFPSNFKLQLRKSDANGCLFKPQLSFPKKKPRNYRSSSLPLWRVSKHNTISVSICKVRSSVSLGSSLRCSCLGTMIDIESAAAAEWVPVIDQVLLTASVLLAYMAGVIPSRRSYINSQKDKNNGLLLPESPIFFGSTTDTEDQVSNQCTWDVVKRKITNSLLAIENGVGVKDNSVEFKSDPVMRPLSLYAIANGPRFRLLLSSIEQLEYEVCYYGNSILCSGVDMYYINLPKRAAGLLIIKVFRGMNLVVKVNKIPDMSLAMEREEWLGLFSSTLKKACQSTLYSWMEKEFCTENLKPDKELLISMSEKLKGDDFILGNVRKSGKMELFADLIGFLRYGYFRECSYYDHNVYPSHAEAVLEDLIISLADAISSIYLEVVSVDSDISEKISNFGLSLCTLSTRALQKLRNEVAMREWIHQNFGEIVLMYEDRFDLRVLKIEPSQIPVENRNESLSWWRRLALTKSATVQSSLCYSVVSPISLTLKRTRELRALKGWKYCFSLILELSDIAVPMVKVVVSQIRNAISFFLVSLIGRSVGLVYTGIRQSLRWK